MFPFCRVYQLQTNLLFKEPTKALRVVAANDVAVAAVIVGLVVCCFRRHSVTNSIWFRIVFLIYSLCSVYGIPT